MFAILTQNERIKAFWSTKFGKSLWDNLKPKYMLLNIIKDYIIFKLWKSDVNSNRIRY